MSVTAADFVPGNTKCQRNQALRLINVLSSLKAYGGQTADILDAARDEALAIDTMSREDAVECIEDTYLHMGSEQLRYDDGPEWSSRALVKRVVGAFVVWADDADSRWIRTRALCEADTGQRDAALRHLVPVILTALGEI